jgi:hypothetical protein
MLAPNLIPAITASVDADLTLYSGPAGALSGAGPGLFAVVGFCLTNPTAVVDFYNTGAGGAVDNNGWGIECAAGGAIAAVYDSVGQKVARYLNLGLSGHWVLAALVVPNDNSEVQLWFGNSKLVQTPLAGPVLPSSDVPRIACTPGAYVFCAGYATGDHAASLATFYTKLVQGNGTVGPESLAAFDNFWSTRFFNDGNHPPAADPQAGAAIWQPQRGALALTAANSPVVTNLTFPWF